MKRHFTFTDGTSNKFWQIETHKNAFTVTYGRIGNAGQSQTKTFADATTCQKEAEKLIREKANKGYIEEGQANSTPTVPRSTKSSESTQTIEEVLASYDEIVKNEALDQLLPFLQSVEKRHYEGLKKHIQEAYRYWTERVYSVDFGFVKLENIGGLVGWKQRGNKKQIDIILLSAMALSNKHEIKSWPSLEFERILEVAVENSSYLAILSWYKPIWLIGFLFEIVNGWGTLSLTTLLKLEQKNIIEYHPELFVKIAIRGSYPLPKNGKELLVNDFEEHIANIVSNDVLICRELPLVFEYDTNLQNRSFHYKDVVSNNWINRPIWKEVFVRLLSQQKIDRKWLIENCLRVQLKLWHNNALLFFRELLQAIQPTFDELLLHQTLIFSLLAADNKQVVNFVIELLKTIHEQPEFDTAQMLPNLAPVLARSDSKTSLKTLLSILEKLLKAQPEYTAQISLLLVNVFNTNDLTLQERAAKLIAKYANPTDTALRDQLQLYRPQLLGNVSQLLSSFLEQTPEVTTEQERYAYRTPTFTLLREENRVKMPQNWEELLFLIGDFISNDTPLKAEIILNSIVLLKPTFPKDWREQFEVYYKKLEKNYYNLSSSGHVLMDLYESNFRTKITHFIMTKDIELNRTLQIKEKYQANSFLPCLSLPTHSPYWIEPKVLINRMLAYENAKEEISILDLSIAICRLVREDTQVAIELCDNVPVKYAELMRYVLGATDKITLVERKKDILGWIVPEDSKVDTELQNLWAVAARSRFPDGEFDEFRNTSLADYRNVITNEKFNVRFSRYMTNIEIHTSAYLKAAGNNPYSYVVEKPYKIPPLFSLTPYYTENLYTSILQRCLKNSGESFSDIYKIAIETFLQDGFIFREMSLWTLAAILLNQKREDRALAAEVLMHHIERQSLSLEALGQKLGYLLAEEYGPVARLTESLELVKDISPLHNDALCQLIEHILQSMLNGETSAVPKNTKKLLEIYVDVLVKTQATPSANTRTLLQPYQSVSSLKTIVKTILEK